MRTFDPSREVLPVVLEAGVGTTWKYYQGINIKVISYYATDTKLSFTHYQLVYT